MARRPRGSSPTCVADTPASLSSSKASKATITTLEQQVAALIGPGPVERFGPYRGAHHQLAVQSATRLVPDLRWNAVVPLPSYNKGEDVADDDDDDLIYVYPARFRRGLPLHLIRYAAQCLLERHSSEAINKGQLTLLLNMKDWKMTSRFDVQQWVECFWELPKVLSAHRILIVNTAAAPDWSKLLDKIKRTADIQQEELPEWVHICTAESELKSQHGLLFDNLPNDLSLGTVPTYRLVEDFIHYRQILEGILERQKRQKAPSPTVTSQQPDSSSKEKQDITSALLKDSASTKGVQRNKTTSTSKGRNMRLLSKQQSMPALNSSNHSNSSAGSRSGKNQKLSSSLHYETTPRRSNARMLTKQESISKLNSSISSFGNNGSKGMLSASLLHDIATPRRSNMRMLTRQESMPSLNSSISNIRMQRAVSQRSLLTPKSKSNASSHPTLCRHETFSPMQKKRSRAVNRSDLMKRSTSLRHVPAGYKTNTGTMNATRRGNMTRSTTTSNVNKDRPLERSSSIQNMKSRPRLTHRTASVPNLQKKITFV